MSPRAAARLETLGFSKVYDHVGEEKDWLAPALLTEGRLAEVETTGGVSNRKMVLNSRLSGQRVDVRAHLAELPMLPWRRLPMEWRFWQRTGS